LTGFVLSIKAIMITIFAVMPSGTLKDYMFQG
jgi:hypothetical protein